MVWRKSPGSSSRAKAVSWPIISDEIRRRAYITIIRRNWHLMPYEQLTQLLGMSPEQLCFELIGEDYIDDQLAKEEISAILRDKVAEFKLKLNERELEIFRHPGISRHCGRSHLSAQ